MEDITPQTQEEQSAAVQATGSKDVTISEQALQALTNEAATWKDKHIRLLAEFENMRKRQERERTEMIKYAHEEVIIETLKVYEDLERSLNAFKAKEGTDPNLVKGLEMVYNNLRDLMATYDVKPISSVGKKFDPNFHEALLQVETTEVPDGQVMEEFQKGYTLAGRVVRTAKVKVAKHV